MSSLPEVIKEYNPLLGAEVMFVVIDGEPWFLGTKCAEALGYKDPGVAVRDHIDKEGVKRLPLITDGGRQEVVLIAEGGMYELCVAAAKFNPKAEAFKKWLFNTLLPTIRRTGTYVSDAATPEQIARARENNLTEKIIAASNGKHVRIGNIVKSLLSEKDGLHKFRVDSWPYINEKLTADKRFAAKEEGMRRLITACEEFGHDSAKEGTLDFSVGMELQALLISLRTGQAHLLKRREGQLKNTIKKIRGKNKKMV